MNALVVQEAKSNFSLFWLVRNKCADNGGRNDSGDFSSTGAGGHLRWRYKFEVLHDGSEELQPSRIVSQILRRGWQRRVMDVRTSVRQDCFSCIERVVVIVTRGVRDRQIQLPCVRTFDFG